MSFARKDVVMQDRMLLESFFVASPFLADMRVRAFEVCDDGAHRDRRGFTRVQRLKRASHARCDVDGKVGNSEQLFPPDYYCTQGGMFSAVVSDGS